MLRQRKLALLLGLLSTLQAAAAQSPGPDFPGCASTSLDDPQQQKKRHPGWRVLGMQYIPPQDHWDAPTTIRGEVDLPFFWADLVNAADGSRSACVLAKKGADRGPRNVTLTNSDGECGTGWGGGGEAGQWEGDIVWQDPPARMSFDTESRVLIVSQTWSCRGSDGEL